MANTDEGAARWLPAARQGSPEALGNVLEACRRYLLWVARRELDSDLQSKGGASDLVQETFLDARRDFARFQGDSEEELLAWLRRILLNNMSNFIRNYRDTAKRRVSDEVSLDRVNAPGGTDTLAGKSQGPCDEIIEREQVEILERAVARLPEPQRSILLAWHREEKSFEEIAHTMGCSPNTVRARWMEGIRRLQRELSDELAP